MDKVKRKQVKALIELSSSVEKANEVIERLVGITEVKEKIAFLNGMFSWGEIIDSKKSDPPELTYNIMLETIINKKFL